MSRPAIEEVYAVAYKQAKRGKKQDWINARDYRPQRESTIIFLERTYDHPPRIGIGAYYDYSNKPEVKYLYFPDDRLEEGYRYSWDNIVLWLYFRTNDYLQTDYFMLKSIEEIIGKLETTNK